MTAGAVVVALAAGVVFRVMVTVAGINTKHDAAYEKSHVFVSRRSKTDGKRPEP